MFYNMRNTCPNKIKVDDLFAKYYFKIMKLL